MNKISSKLVDLECLIQLFDGQNEAEFANLYENLMQCSDDLKENEISENEDLYQQLLFNEAKAKVDQCLALLLSKGNFQETRSKLKHSCCWLLANTTISLKYGFRKKLLPYK